MNFKRLLTRCFYYFRVGYSTYLSLPVALIGYASAVYYLAVKGSLFEQVFPRFTYFIIFVLLILPPTAILIGWLHLKKSSFFKAEQDILTETSPYTTEFIAPINLPFWEAFIELCNEHRIDTTELNKIIANSRRRFQRTQIRKFKHVNNQSARREAPFDQNPVC